MRRGSKVLRELPRAALAALVIAMLPPFALTCLGTGFEPPTVTLPEVDPLPGTFEDFVEGRQRRSHGEGARPGNEERFIPSRRPDPPFAVLYVHGFVASRAEGEEVMEDVAETLDVPVHFLRLPGHGTTAADLAGRRLGEWVDEVALSLTAVQSLAPKVAVVGTSMGAGIATYLAARRPEQVDALVLASPFFAFRDPTARVLTVPGGLALAAALLGGERRVPLDPSDPEDHRRPGFEGYWYAAYPLSAVQELARVGLLVNQPRVHRQVEAPSLLLYYYRDEARQDVAASVSAMREAADRFPEGPLRREVAIPDGDHVLLSAWVRSDHDRARTAMIAFLREVFPE